MSSRRGPVYRFGRWISGMGRKTKEDSRKIMDRGTPDPIPDHRRFLGDASRRAAAFVEAARQYKGKVSGFELEWLYRKPYDPRPGNEQFFLQVYAVMNLIKSMDVRPGGRVLEIGSGPGWVSELLMLLGYEVDGVEPCAELVELAEKRIENANRHYQISEPPRVEFHLTTLEEVELASQAFDAVLFHDALHHAIDENVAMER